MESRDELRRRIKVMLVNNLMLSMSADELGDDVKLFGPDSLGLDSVDALQIVVALEKEFGLKIRDNDSAKLAMASVSTLMEAVARHLDSKLNV
jgi:acyl carrier protein